MSGAKRDRSGLAAALDYVRDGEDTLAVARLDQSLPDALRMVRPSPTEGWG